MFRERQNGFQLGIVLRVEPCIHRRGVSSTSLKAYEVESISEFNAWWIQGFVIRGEIKGRIYFNEAQNCDKL